LRSHGTLNAPIVHAIRGKEFIEYDNPFDAGMTGLLGFSSGYHAIMNADLLLMIGTDFPYQQFFPSDATIVQIDVRWRTTRSADQGRHRRFGGLPPRMLLPILRAVAQFIFDLLLRPMIAKHGVHVASTGRIWLAAKHTLVRRSHDRLRLLPRHLAIRPI
jgi:hypothetical protein